MTLRRFLTSRWRPQRAPRLGRRRAGFSGSAPIVVVAAALFLASPLAGRAWAQKLPAPPVMVPEGVWWTRLEAAPDSQTRAYNDLNTDSPLLEWLVPDATTRADLSGEVTRDVSRFTWDTVYGLSDRWNLVLGLPYTRVEQHSTLVAGATATAQAAAARLADRTVSGLGRLLLGSRHRPVFSDRNGFIVGYGLQWPTNAPVQPWAGRGTLQTDSPFPRVYARVHYTRYLMSMPARLELGAESGYNAARQLSLESGGTAEVSPGHDLAASAGWGQQFGPVDTALALRLFRQGMTRIEGATQGDDMEALAVHLALGFGNLTALESGPVDLPYQVGIAYDHTLSGRNTPDQRIVRLSLELYF